MECRFSFGQTLRQCQSGGTVHDFVMLPLFFLAMYEKDGQPLEVIARHFIQTKFVRPKVRPYRTNNYYDVLMRQNQLEKEVKQIVLQKEKTGTRSKNACESDQKTAERN